MTKIPNPKQFKSVIAVLIVSFVLFPAVTLGAKLYLESAEEEYHLEDVFIVKVKLDTEDEYINTAKVNLTFSQEILEVQEFSKGNSILIFWVEEPSFSDETGTIFFSGGIPGGFQGEDGLLGKIIFKVHGPTQIGTQINTNIEFSDNSQVLLNDGFGTPAQLTTKGAAFNILAEKLEPPTNEWLREIIRDDVPPEPFEIEISQDPSIFEGKYFIVFSTTDKQTGIDHYEVCEHTKPHECEYEKTQNWKTGESPYVLEDQTLRSIIKVKAVDKAGNETIAEYIPPKPFPYYWIILIIIIGLVIIGWIVRKFLISKS